VSVIIVTMVASIPGPATSAAQLTGKQPVSPYPAGDDDTGKACDVPGGWAVKRQR
jgi:hypothetical protein